MSNLAYISDHQHYNQSTTGALSSQDNFSMPSASTVVGAAWKEVENASEESVRNYSKRLLFTIDILMRKYEMSHIIKPIHASCIDDGSVTLEWIYNEFRIGFTVEKEDSESGWYVVSNPNSGFTNANGELSINNLDIKLLTWLLLYLAINA